MPPAGEWVTGATRSVSVFTVELPTVQNPPVALLPWHRRALISVSVDATVPATAAHGVAPTLKVLGEPTRLEIVRRLAAEDLCTCHLVEDLGMAQPLVSHHLRVLRQAGLVRAEPCGAFTYYVLERPVLAEIADVLGALAEQPARPRRRPCT
jgi:ArsR family transcriptional regulator, arsenate/arsenite/antimonite-responsive transcriptional repressor